MTKKVLLICGSELCNAGVPNVIMKIVRGLQSSYTFDVLCLSEKYGEYDAEFSSYGGKIYRLPLPDYAVLIVRILSHYPLLHQESV